MKIKSAPGLKLRDPKTKMIIPESGIEIPEPPTGFWLKRLNAGDAVEVKQEVSKPASKKESKGA